MHIVIFGKFGERAALLPSCGDKPAFLRSSFPNFEMHQENRTEVLKK